MLLIREKLSLQPDVHRAVTDITSSGISVCFWIVQNDKINDLIYIAVSFLFYVRSWPCHRDIACTDFFFSRIFVYNVCVAWIIPRTPFMECSPITRTSTETQKNTKLTPPMLHVEIRLPLIPLCRIWETMLNSGVYSICSAWFTLSHWTEIAFIHLQFF